MTEEERLRLHQTRPLPEYMSLLSKNRSTGTLVASTDDDCREVLVVDGEIRAARSTIEEEKLGLWLVSRDRISESERALTLLSQGGSDAPPLGHLLVTRGCIDQEGLEHELADLVLTIVRRAASAPHTYCEFKEGLDGGQPDTIPDLTTPQIILEAARAFGDAEAMEDAIGSLDQVAWPSSALDTLLHELDLTPTEAFVLSRLDGTRMLSSLIAVSSLSQEDAISTVYTLKVAGIVSVGAMPRPIPAPLPASAQRRQQPEELLHVVDESLLAPGQLDERESVRRLAEMAPRVDHYQALGLRPGSSSDLIRGAWRNIRERYAPDRSADSHLRDMRAQLGSIYERAHEAYEILIEPSSKNRYDEILDSLEEEELLRTKRRRRGTDQGARQELVKANLKRADELVNEGEVYLAIRLLEQACSLDPRPVELLKLAKLLLRNPLWTNRALHTIRKAIEADSGFVEAWIELAEFWRRRNSQERQRKALERALAASPDDERACRMYRQLVGSKELDRILEIARRRRR